MSVYAGAQELAQRVIRDNGPSDISDEGKLARAVVALDDECGRLREQLEQAERMGNEWGAESLYHLERAQKAEALGALLREQLDAARLALKKIADGTWNTGTGLNLTAREFARAALGVEGEQALCPCTDIAGSGERGAPDPDCDECEGSGAALRVEGEQEKP